MIKLLLVRFFWLIEKRRKNLLNHKPIALYFYRLDRSAGGAERIICMLANEFAEREFPVHLITWDEGDAQAFYPLNKKVRWHRLGFHHGLMDKIRRTCLLTRTLNENDIRVLIGFVMSGDKTVYTAAKISKTRLIVAERNAPQMYYMRYNALQRHLSFVLLHLADRIVVQFPSFIHGYPTGLRERMVVIPNPVPMAVNYADPGMPGKNGRFTLLSVSRLDDKQKRLGCLLRAFAKFSDERKDWDLRIVGDGPFENNLQRLARDLGITSRVAFEPSRSDISSIYTNAQLFVISSLWEGFSNALAEAMAHGLPAVGFEGAPGVNDLIKNGETGWLAKGLDNPTTLSVVLKEAMGNHKERERRGALAIEKMGEYAPEKQFDRWAELLSSLY